MPPLGIDVSSARHSWMQSVLACCYTRSCYSALASLLCSAPIKCVTGSITCVSLADGNKASGILIFEDTAALEAHLHTLANSKQVSVIQQYLEKPWLIEHADVPNDPEYFAGKLPYLRSKKFDSELFVRVNCRKMCSLLPLLSAHCCLYTLLLSRA